MAIEKRENDLLRDKGMVQISDEEARKATGGVEAKYHYTVNTRCRYCAPLLNDKGKVIDRLFPGDKVESTHHLWAWKDQNNQPCNLRYVRRNAGSPFGWVNDEYLNFNYMDDYADFWHENE